MEFLESKTLRSLGLFLFCIPFLFLFGGCGLADIRPATLIESGISADATRQGKELLGLATKAHGGLERWQAHKTAEVVFSDEWPGLIPRTFFMPWSGSKSSMRIHLLLGKDVSRLEFLEGDKRGEVWGLQNWATYRIAPGAQVEFEADDTVKFWLPTVGYFFELPFRIGEADIIAFIGEHSFGGEKYDLVFASWKQAEPQKAIDQYVVWVNRKSRLVDYIQYTIRDMMASATGYMHYSDYRNVQGIMVPFQMTAASEPGAAEFLHKMVLTDVKFGVGVSEGFLFPDPEKRGAK